jgi:hypothetical protein
LGEEFFNLPAGACPLTELEAVHITVNPLDLTGHLGTNRDMTMEEFFMRTLVPRVVPETIESTHKTTVGNFTSYGTKTIIRLGAGERAGVVDSFRAVFNRVPKTECDWQMALRIANTKLPGTLNSEREAQMKDVFKKIWKRAPNMSDEKDNIAMMMMTYGLRPQVRSLALERVAIQDYRRIFGKTPFGATAWDTMRAIAYSGLPKP